jgi:hypothetical protein
MKNERLDPDSDGVAGDFDGLPRQRAAGAHRDGGVADAGGVGGGVQARARQDAVVLRKACA